MELLFHNVAHYCAFFILDYTTKNIFCVLIQVELRNLMNETRKLTIEEKGQHFNTLLYWTDASVASLVTLGGGGGRGVNLPSPYFLSQFLPPPYFLSQVLPPP